MARRDILIGGACTLGAIAAQRLKPSHHQSLMGNGTLATIVPQTIGRWQMAPINALAAPESDDALASKLYSDSLTRVYADDSGAQMMLLMAYGPSQTNTLQLHRPEECFPAFGFEIVDRGTAAVALTHGQSLPMRQLIARTPLRREHISYWTRIGDALPTSAAAQRRAILNYALHGVIVDGLLVRCSNVVPNPDSAFALNQAFTRDVLHAIAPHWHAALIGPTLAAAIA